MTWLFTIIAAFAAGALLGRRRQINNSTYAPSRPQSPSHSITTPKTVAITQEKSGVATPSDNTSVQTSNPRESQNQDLYSDEAFVQRNHVTPHCSGKKCNQNIQCNNGERMFCMNVMSKLDARYAGRWAGQYHVEMVPKSRRIDFALQLPDGRGIGIEFDGYSSHGNLDIVKFQDQIDRNNALVAKGWVLLRFSYIDAKEHADSCINIINGIFNSANAIGSARLPWVHCAHCQGKMTHTIIKGKPYWKCENCLKLFFDNNGKPSKNEVVSRNT